MRTRRIPRPLLVVLSIGFWVGVWWLVAARFGKPLLLPTPPAVLRTLCALAKTADFWRAVGASLGRIGIGILLAFPAGGLLALLTVKSRILHTLFSPLLTLFKATPVASVIFLLLLWVGRGRVALLISFMMALPIVWSSVREGLLQTDRGLLEMVEVFRVPPMRRLWRLRLPSLFPYVLAAARSAIGLSWKAGVAAEVLCVPDPSLGRAIYEGKQYLLTAELFAYTLTVVLISVAIEGCALALLRLSRRFAFGEGEADA